MVWVYSTLERTGQLNEQEIARAQKEWRAKVRQTAQAYTTKAAIAQTQQAAKDVRDKALMEIQRWMLAEFLENEITGFAGDNITKTYTSGVAGLVNTVYTSVLDDVRRLTHKMNSVRQSLLRLVEADGMYEVIANDVQDQKNRANTALRKMLAAGEIKFKYLTLEKGVLMAENYVVQLLLIRAWGRCYVDFQNGMLAALMQLINDLSVQNTRSITRIRDLLELHKQQGDGTNLAAKYYTALFVEIGKGG